MRSRLFVAGCGVATLLGLSACGGSDGTGASTASTTVNLSSPVYATLPAATTTSTIAPAPSADGVTPVANEQAYTVVTGDYLLAIAKKFCISLDTLVAYNAWPEGADHRYFAGDVFKIPPLACAPSTAAATAPATGTESSTVAPVEPQVTSTTIDASGGGTYTVVADDYLTGIAKKLGTTVDAIVAANGWSDGADHVIIPGQKIKTPAKTS